MVKLQLESALLWQGKAYMSLEDYVKAKAQIMAGLSVVPFHEDLHKALQEAQTHLVDSRPTSPAPQLPSSSGTSSKRWGKRTPLICRTGR